MKYAILALLCSSLFSFAATKGSITLHVTAKDYQGRIYKGETIQFVGQKSAAPISGTTDASGAMDVLLTPGENYQILFLSLVGPYNCGVVNVPANAGNGSWTVEFENTTVELKNVLFDTGKATLRNSSNAELNKLVEGLKRQDTIKIEIAGHTDNVGTGESNRILSQGRAESVMGYLVSKGIAQSRITAVGYGYTQPIADNSTENGRALNRRTEVRILNLKRD